MVKLLEEYFYSYSYNTAETMNPGDNEPRQPVIHQAHTGGSTVRRSQPELDALEPYESILLVSCEPMQRVYQHNYYNNTQQSYYNNTYNRRGQYSMAFM